MSFPASRVISHDRLAVKHKSISMKSVDIGTKNDDHHNNDRPLFDARAVPFDIKSYSKYPTAASASSSSSSPPPSLPPSDKNDFHSSNRSYDPTTRKPSISHKQSKETPSGKYSSASSYESTSSISSTNSLSTSPSKPTLNTSMVSGRSESSKKDKSRQTKNVDTPSNPVDDCADINFASMLPVYTPKETYRRSSESSVSSRSSSSIRPAKRQPPLISIPCNTSAVNNTETVTSPIQLTDTWNEAIISPQPVPMVSRISCNSSHDSLTSMTDNSRFKAGNTNESAISDTGSFINSYLYLDPLPLQSSGPSPSDSILSTKSMVNNNNNNNDTVASNSTLQSTAIVPARRTSSATISSDNEESAFGVGSVSTPNHQLPTRNRLGSSERKTVSSGSEDDSQSDEESDEDEDEEICTARAIMTPFSAKFSTSFLAQQQQQQPQPPPPPPSASTKADYRKTISGTFMPTSAAVPIQRLMTPVVVAARRNNPSSTETNEPSLMRSRSNSHRRSSVDSPTSRDFVKLPTRPCSIASPLPLSPSELRHLARLGAEDDSDSEGDSTPVKSVVKKSSNNIRNIKNNDSNNNRSRARSSVEIELDVPLIQAKSAETSEVSTSQELSATSSSDTKTKMQRFCTPDMPTDFLTDRSMSAEPFDLNSLKTASATLARSHRPKSSSASSIVIQDTLKYKSSFSSLSLKSSDEHVISRRGSLPSDMNNLKLTTTTAEMDDDDDDDTLPPLPGSNRSSVSSCLSVLPPPVKSKSPLRKSLSQGTAQDATDSFDFVSSEAPARRRTGSVDFGGKATLSRSIVEVSSQDLRVSTANTSTSNSNSSNTTVIVTVPPTRTGSTPPISMAKHSHNRKGSSQSSLLNNGASPRTSISSRRSSVASLSSRASTTDKSGNQLDSLEAFIRSQFGLNQQDKSSMHHQSQYQQQQQQQPQQQQQRSMSDVSMYPPPLPSNAHAVSPKNITTGSSSTSITTTKPSPSASYKHLATEQAYSTSMPVNKTNSNNSSNSSGSSSNSHYRTHHHHLSPPCL
ncbi:hypothetical protein BDF22DRAFT_468047 [Syncephalis plumigaleata]|nr:hypothetical protein BDF22DRAFT_468047 [Syncephalis plumigaleata]